MKKLLKTFALGALAFTLAACGSSTEAGTASAAIVDTQAAATEASQATEEVATTASAEISGEQHQVGNLVFTLPDEWTVEDYSDESNGYIAIVYRSDDEYFEISDHTQLLEASGQDFDTLAPSDFEAYKQHATDNAEVEAAEFNGYSAYKYAYASDRGWNQIVYIWTSENGGYYEVNIFDYSGISEEEQAILDSIRVQ